MSFSVLVATPTVAFGDLIQHSLEDLGRFEVKTAHTVAEARGMFDLYGASAAILDGDLGESEFRELAAYLSAKTPATPLIVLPPDNDPRHPTLNGINIAALLHKPFYMPDLTDLMERLADEQAITRNHWPSPADLEKRIAGTLAVGAILASASGQMVLGGAFSEEAESELSQLARQFWGREEHSDLVRFVSLDHGKLDCLVFLTEASDLHDAVLGLVFPAATPFSKVRNQSRPIALGVRELLAAQLPESETTAVPVPASSIAGPPLEAAVEDTQPVRISPVSPPSTDIDAWVEEEEALPDFNLAEMLGTIPSPDPTDELEQPLKGIPANEWLAKLLSGTGTGSVEDSLKMFSEPEGGMDEDVDAPAHPEEDRLRWEEEDVDAPKEIEEPAASLESAATPPEFSPVDTARGWMDGDSEAEDDHGRGISSLADLEHLDPISAVFSLIHYSCVLVPRLPQHVLTGELMEALDPWVRQLCLAFGWRLEAIALDREYLQWTVLVAPSISPGNVVKIVRQQTSDLIFGHNETLRQQNPSGDFWANGYLALSGIEPPSAELLRDYIAHIRRGQGVGLISKRFD